MSLGTSGGASSMPVLAVSNERNRVDEMDFFSNEKKLMSAVEPDLDLKVRSVGMKNEDHTINTGLHLSSSDQSTVDDGMSQNEDDKENKSEIASMQVELARMNEENQKLRGMLNQVTTNYNSLQMHVITLMQQKNQHLNSAVPQHGIANDKIESRNNDVIVPRQFMDLGPVSNGGNEPSQSSTASRERSSSPSNTVEVGSTNYGLQKIGINCEKSIREDSPDERWNPNKAPKLTPPKSITDQQAQEATMRKARVSVRARSEAPMITDGCQWRKYGQKMAKGNPCPRAYYRCTMATGCPVRKQVQRCAEDRSVLITTYEGTHNHPLPPAAMAMASTTSAAASMLLSGSMSSTDGLINSNFLARTILPCSSNMATISASAPFPTVTLDLTHSPNPLQFQRPQSQFPVHFAAPPPQPSLPQVFGQMLSNQSKFSGLQMSGPELQASQLSQMKPQSNFADSVSAATAAITADPNFTAALAAAITSIMGGNQAGNSTSGNNACSNGNSNSNNSNPSS